jgi:hypothetical protein
MKEKNMIVLKRGFGDRILLGSLSMTMIIIFGSMAAYFIKTEEKSIISTLGFEFSFVAMFISVLGLSWAVATPQFIEKIIEKQIYKVIVIAMLVLIGAIIMLIYPMVQKA